LANSSVAREELRGAKPIARDAIKLRGRAVDREPSIRTTSIFRRSDDMEATEATSHESGLAAAAALFSAEDLRRVMTQHEIAERAKKEASANEAATQRAELVKQLSVRVDITEEKIADFMTHVHRAAEQGEKQLLIIRFPSEVCSDGGRAINNALEGWEQTLVGLPKQVHEIWSERLKSRGFRLHAEVLDYPHGMPGDIGLFCLW
jgi:hypothetical protein